MPPQAGPGWPRKPRVTLRKLTEDYCEFLLEDSDPCFANALRRVIIAEVCEGRRGGAKGERGAGGRAGGGPPSSERCSLRGTRQSGSRRLSAPGAGRSRQRPAPRLSLTPPATPLSCPSVPRPNHTPQPSSSSSTRALS